MAKVEKRTYRDRAQYLIKAVAKRRRKIKELAVAYKDGACQICGYNKYLGALDLHHIDAKTKSFGIGDKGYTRSWVIVQQEADKCILVCANCHREVEAGITQLPAETLVEKRGELREVPTTSDNPQPSAAHAVKVQRLSRHGSTHVNFT